MRILATTRAKQRKASIAYITQMIALGLLPPVNRHERRKAAKLARSKAR